MTPLCQKLMAATAATTSAIPTRGATPVRPSSQSSRHRRPGARRRRSTARRSAPAGAGSSRGPCGPRPATRMKATIAASHASTTRRHGLRAPEHEPDQRQRKARRRQVQEVEPREHQVVQRGAGQQLHRAPLRERRRPLAGRDKGRIGLGRPDDAEGQAGLEIDLVGVPVPGGGDRARARAIASHSLRSRKRLPALDVPQARPRWAPARGRRAA